MSSRKRIVIIGGSAAGPKAAARARRIDSDAEITIIQKDPDLSMASCGYPYYIGGLFDDRKKLICTPTGVVRDATFFINVKDITAKVRVEATGIDRTNHKVHCRDLENDDEFDVDYDRLIIATGAIPVIPPIPGSDLEGITTLHSIEDADFLRRIRDEGKIKKAVVVGGGLIGVETCEALQLAGIEITIVEMLPQILSFMDIQLAKLVENNARSWGTEVITSNAVAEFLGEEGMLTGVKLSDGTKIPCELAVVSVGVRPNTKIADEAGLEIGDTGGIVVNEYMQTSDPEIFAIGDCIEVTHRITGKKVYAPYGDLANLQGRVAGENAASENRATFPGTIQTSICKFFNYTTGSTGLDEKQARELGYDVASVVTAGPDKPGFMGGLPLISKMVVESGTGRLLGFQCVGTGNAAKEIGQAAVAIMGKMTIDDLINADLPYAPPFSLAVDNLIAVAHVLQNKMRGLMVGISSEEVKKKIDAGEKPFMLDLRGPDEYEDMRLGIGKLIPLGALRKRLDEIPQDKDAEIICYCKISLRGYEGARFLMAKGWRNVKVMEGGILAWPYPREK